MRLGEWDYSDDRPILAQRGSGRGDPGFVVRVLDQAPGISWSELRAFRVPGQDRGRIENTHLQAAFVRAA
jgi:hypothetical protein